MKKQDNLSSWLLFVVPAALTWEGRTFAMLVREASTTEELI